MATVIEHPVEVTSRLTNGPAAKVAVKIAMLASAVSALDEMGVLTDHDARLVRDVKDYAGGVVSTFETLYRELRAISLHYPIVENNSDRVAFGARLNALFLELEA